MLPTTVSCRARTFLPAVQNDEAIILPRNEYIPPPPASITKLHFPVMSPEESRQPDSDGPARPQMAIWASPQAIEYALSVASRLESPVTAIGTPGTSDPPILSDGAEIDSFDDLRTGPVESGAEAVLLADRRFDPTASIQGEPRLCTLEPLERPTAVNQPVHLLGSFVRSAGFKAALQIIDDFGPITSMHITSHCCVGQGSLYARLYDAVITVLCVLGGPDMIDAMLVPPITRPGAQSGRAHIEPLPEGLSQLTGDLGTLIRCQPLGLATISASDQACWERRVRILGPAGTLSIDQSGVSWREPSGKVIEEHSPDDQGFKSACRQAAEEADQWLSGHLDPSQTVDSGLAIATCEATRLSCRTREPESTQKVQELLSRT